MNKLFLGSLFFASFAVHAVEVSCRLYVAKDDGVIKFSNIPEYETGELTKQRKSLTVGQYKITLSVENSKINIPATVFPKGERIQRPSLASASKNKKYVEYVYPFVRYIVEDNLTPDEDPIVNGGFDVNVYGVVNLNMSRQKQGDIVIQCTNLN